MIRYLDVKKLYGRKTMALDGVSLDVPPGIFCLLGPNGAGKTTMIKIACGVLLPDRGDVVFDGTSVLRRTKAVQQKVAAVFENAENAYGYLSVEDNLRYFGYLWGIGARALDERIDRLLRRLELTDKRSESFSKLSRGMKQKVAVAMALIREPQYLFLDEPTMGLDVFAAEKVKAIIREWADQPGKTVILTTHDMALAQEMGEWFAFISGGRMIWQGRKQDLSGLPAYRVEYSIVIRGEVPEELADRTTRNNGLSCVSVSADELAGALVALGGADVVDLSRNETDLEQLFREVIAHESDSVHAES